MSKRSSTSKSNQPTKKKTDTAVIVALLMLIGTLGAAVCASPVLPELIKLRSAQVPTVSVFQERNGLVVMEAEHFTDTRPGAGEATSTKWQSITTVDGYSGASALQALPDEGVQPDNYANGPSLLYNIEFSTPGTYYVFIRGYAPDNVVLGGNEFDSNDSVHVGLNGKAVTIGEGIGLTGFRADNFTWQGRYADKETSVVIPQPGRYIFYLWMREDGVVVDKILLSTDANVIASGDKGVGPNESFKVQ